MTYQRFNPKGWEMRWATVDDSLKILDDLILCKRLSEVLIHAATIGKYKGVTLP